MTSELLCRLDESIAKVKAAKEALICKRAELDLAYQNLVNARTEYALLASQVEDEKGP